MKELARGRSDLVHALQKRSAQLRELDKKYWRVIGEGPIGDKAQQMRDKTWAIEQAGFELIPRTVLSMGFFEEFRRMAGIDNALGRGAPRQELEDRVWDTEFSQWQLEAISGLSKTLQPPAVVRSSAFGDSRGTGAYESIFYTGNSSLENKIRYVLASEFGEKAMEYRRLNGIEPGMAVIIEPVFGKWWNPVFFDEIQAGEKHFGPLYSGVAHSNSANGHATAIVCGGLPIMAVRGIGISLTERSRSIEKAVHKDHVRLDEIREMEDITNVLVAAYTGMFFEAECDTPVENGVPISNTRGKNIRWLFDRLRKLEELIGKPQYVEWAVLERKAKQGIAVLQIADLTIENDFYELVDSENLFIRSDYVVGKPRVECSAVVEMHGGGNLEDLIRYNAKHEDYLVIYPGNLTSYDGQMLFTDISNAAVLAERKYSKHSKRPEEHFGGLLEQTGKTLLVIRRANTLMEKLGDPVHDERYPTLDIYPVKTRTLANPRLKQAIVELA